MVLIHGAGGNHLYWPPEIRRLRGFRVFALDLPGHGKSEGPGEQSIQSYQDTFLRWLDFLGLQKIILVGHSMGGAIALRCASLHPERVLGLGLISTGARLKVHPSLLESTAGRGSQETAVEFIIRHSFSDQANPRLVTQAAQRFKETRPSVLHGDFLACDAFDMRQDLGTLPMQTLVLCGDQDRMTPLRFSQYLARQLPNADLEVIREAGHMVILEKPREVAARLLTFLEKIS
jgi:pimeloyl-ACP methyl ester carboxylesterase